MARKRLPTVLSDQELEALLSQVRTTSPTGLRNKALLKVMAYAGLRVSEVVALRTSDIRRENGRVTLEVRRGKGDRDRMVPLADHVAESLDAWLKARREIGLHNGPVFCTLRAGRHIHPAATAGGFTGDQLREGAVQPGQPLSPRYIQALVARLARRAGIERRVSPHSLRHTAATRMLRAQGDLRRVQMLLGHASVATTQVYTHVVMADLEEAVDRVPDVEQRTKEARPDPQAEARAIAAEILAALPDSVRAALAAHFSTPA